MKTDLKKEEKNLVKIDIEIPADEVMTEYNKAVKRISQYANIPGFRKGKAPKNIVEKHFGVDAIKQEALDGILPNALRDAILEHNLDVIAQPTIEKMEFEVGQDLKLTAAVELRPEVKLGQYKDLTLTVDEYVTPDDAFDKSLEQFMQRHATFNVVVDRAANEKDICKIDFDGSANGEKIQGGEAKDYTLDLGNSNFIPGFAEQIVGHKVGEEFDINVEFPKEYHEKKLAGQPAVFKIKLNEIKEKVMPELTDEFVAKVGPFKSVAELKDDIQKYLDETQKGENERNSKNALFEKILNDAKVEIPEKMIEAETENLLNEYRQRLAMQGLSLDDAMKAQGEDKVKEEIKKDAEKRIKTTLVIDKIAQEEKITVSPEDLSVKLQQVEAAYSINRETLLKEFKKNPDAIGSLSQQALNEKVFDYLVENNKIEFKKSK